MSSQIKICIAGATGKIGRQLVRAICESADLELVGAVSRGGQNRKLGEVLSDCPAKVQDLLVSGTTAQALETQTDVLIDYTRPEAARVNVKAAILQGVNVVVGTSGLQTDDYANMDALAREHQVGVIAASNFALTLALLQFCAARIAEYIPSWEIIDYAPSDVLMAPLGTTRELAHRLSEHLSPPNEAGVGPTSRGENVEGTRIHSLRLPGYISCVEAIFGLGDEQLVLRHTCNSPAAYVDGTLLAVRKVSSYVGLVRGLDRILEIS
jgi:4-hydroxy-tetrahydrodipicolinate reductase